MDYGFSRTLLRFPSEIVVPDAGRCVGPGMADIVLRVYRVGVGAIEEVDK